MILYVVVREIGFHGGSKVSIPLQAYQSEEAAKGQVRALTGAMQEVLELSLVQMKEGGKADNVGQTVKDVLVDMGVADYNHSIVQMSAEAGDPGNVVSISDGGIIIPT
jgi:hypothetical protein